MHVVWCVCQFCLPVLLFTYTDVNKERIRLVGGLRAMLALLKELSLSQSCNDLEQAVHLVRLLTTSVTDNGKCGHIFSLII